MLGVFLSLKAIGFDFSGILPERLTMIGGNDSPLPWHVLPIWMSGLFAAAIASAVLAHFASVLNSSAALYVCDIHEKYIQPKPPRSKSKLRE